MVEEQKQRIEQEISKVVNDIELNYLRDMEAKMHRCAAKCCEDRQSSLEGVRKCVDRCSAQFNWAQQYFYSELENVPNKLQRCVMDCNDEIRVKVGPEPSQAEMEKFTAMFDKCAKTCVDKQIEYIPSLVKRIKSELNKHNSAALV